MITDCQTQQPYGVLSSLTEEERLYFLLLHVCFKKKKRIRIFTVFQSAFTNQEHVIQSHFMVFKHTLKAL